MHLYGGAQALLENSDVVTLSGTLVSAISYRAL